MSRRSILITGIVQGVGFRPHVYRLAHELGVQGTVANTTAGVIVDVQGPPGALDALTARVRAEAPPAAQVHDLVTRDLPEDPQMRGFTIVASTHTGHARTVVPPDIATCERCLTELLDPTDRRYRHPFITCTDCGPRFTIITGLPYDRPRTTMAHFAMCDACRLEYTDPVDRRFHAQPVACPTCGPTLWALDGGTRTHGDEAALTVAQHALADGAILAVKGLGGYHLACRADDPEAISRLRHRKRRPVRPFAVMAASRAVAEQLIAIDGPTGELLTSPQRPIVIARKIPGAPVAANVAPGIEELGVMLAYTPVHHLLLGPGTSGGASYDLLVMTSANRSDEPLYYRDDQISDLTGLADVVLGHDRPIAAPCDDSVMRVVDGLPYPVRRSRGYAPVPIATGVELPAVLAVGGELKNTVCALDGDRAICSQHLGDMAGWESQGELAQNAARLLSLHEIAPTRWAADAHPAYQTRAWAARLTAVPLVEVQHHRAHAASLLAEHRMWDTPCLVACFDGTGYGDDGTAWGGEWLLAGSDVLDRGAAAITRAASLAPVVMVGGDQAVREPWRLALAHLRRAGVDWTSDLAPVAALAPAQRILFAQLIKQEHAPMLTTSMGRLFDAVAALLDVRQEIGYEAQAAIELEVLAASRVQGEPTAWRGDEHVACAGGVHEAPVNDPREMLVDPSSMIRALVAGMRQGRDRGTLALGFHVWVARAVRDVAIAVRARTGTDHVGLTGGVFANVVLLRCSTALLHDAGLRVVRHQLVPCNDGGLSLGQAVLAATTKE